MRGYQVLFAVVAIFKGLHAARLTGISNDDVVYACQGSDISLSWHVELGPGESIILLEWDYPSGQALAGKVRDHYFRGEKFPNRRTSPLGNAGIILHEAVLADTGRFSVWVMGTFANGTAFHLRHSANVQVFDSLMTTDGHLHIYQDSEPVLDKTTGQWAIHLLCGNFSFLGRPPFSVQWITPDGVVRKSSSYDSRGYFHLPLSGAVPSGTYRCRVPEQDLGKHSCLQSQAPHRHHTGASTRVDGVQTSLAVMATQVQWLTAQTQQLGRRLDQGPCRPCNVTVNDDAINVTVNDDASDVTVSDDASNVTVNDDATRVTF